MLASVCTFRPVLTPVSAHPPPPGLSSDSDLTSLAVDTDSLAELDDGMASGRTSPNQPQGGASNISSSCSPLLPSLYEHRSPSPAIAPAPGSPAPAPGSPALNPEVNRPSRTALFSSSLKRATGANAKEVKPDYLDKAGEHIRLAVQKEAELDYQSAFSYYRSGVDLLLQGVQGEFERGIGVLSNLVVVYYNASKMSAWG